MGTNYYHHTDECPTCGHGERTHIGKSLIMFEGIFEWDETTGESKCVIGSWADWKARLRGNGAILDEYGERYTFPEFVRMVEATDLDARRRQHDWFITNDPHRLSDVPAPDKEWLDADGFSFSGRWFC